MNENLKPKKPTIGETFKTQCEAIRFLKNLLPTEWLWREENPDYFVDFHVEVVEQGEPTGFGFRTQVKGTKRGNKFALKRQLKCKHLLYYRDRSREPVFIILVDLVGKTAHWLFAQKHLRDCPNSTAIDKQKTFTIKFDPADSLNDLERFREALRSADRYMRELRPGSPAAAVSSKEAELHRLDPDIRVKVSFDDGEILRFDSKKQLHYTFHGLTPEGFKSFQAMLDHGDDFESAVEEVTPPDSPLFKKLMKGKNGHIQFKPDRPDGFLQIGCAATEAFIPINGTWRVGRKSIRFEGRLEKSPLQVELRIQDWLEGTTPKISLETPVSLAAWEGQSVLQLAWFDQVRSLVSALAEAHELTITYFLNGTKMGQVQAVADKSSPVNASVERVTSWVNWLVKVREVAMYYGANVALPKWEDITYQMQSAVEALDDLANGRVREESISGSRFKILASPNLKFLEDDSSPVLGAMKLMGSATFNFLEREITIPNVEQVLANMRLVSTSATPTAKEFVFEGQEGAILTRRRIAA